MAGTGVTRYPSYVPGAANKLSVLEPCETEGAPAAPGPLSPAAAGGTVVSAGEGRGAAVTLAQVFGWLGDAAQAAPRRRQGGCNGARLERTVPNGSGAVAFAVAPFRRRRAVLLLPFLLLHPGLVMVGLFLPMAAGVAIAAFQLARDPAAVPTAAAPAGVAAAARLGTAERGPASVRPGAAALDQVEREVQAARGQYDALDPGQDARGGAAAAWREGLRQEADRLRQRREAARATLAAARTLMAGQPDSVLALRETTAQQAGNEEARATLLRLQVEREHLAAQYVSSYPALRELDRKIAVVRAGLEEGRRPSVSRTREVRNPALDQLGQRAALAQVDLAAAEAQLAEVGRQLAAADARRAELAAAETRLRELERRRDALRWAEYAAADGAAPVQTASTQSAAAAQDGAGHGASPRQEGIPGVANRPVAAMTAAASPQWRSFVPAAAGLGFGAAVAGVLWLIRRRVLAAAAFPVRANLPMEILPPPEWPYAAGRVPAPEIIWGKPGVGRPVASSSVHEALPPRLRAPVGAGARWA